MRHPTLLLAAALALGCGPSFNNTSTAVPGYDLTVAYARVGPSAPVAACFDDRCTTARAPDADGRVSWNETFRVTREDLVEGMRLTLSAAPGRPLCAGLLVRFEQADLDRGEADVLCSGPITHVRFRAAP